MMSHMLLTDPSPLQQQSIGCMQVNKLDWAFTTSLQGKVTQCWAGQGRAGQGRAWQGMAGQGRAGQGRAGHHLANVQAQGVEEAVQNHEEEQQNKDAQIVHRHHPLICDVGKGLGT